MSAPLEVVLVPRVPPATEGWLRELRALYPPLCETKCWHSSCLMIRDLESRVAATRSGAS